MERFAIDNRHLIENLGKKNRLFCIFFTLMKRKSEQFGHESFLGQNCPESKLQKRAFIKLIFYVFCDFRIDKGVHELLGHPLHEKLVK